MHKFALLGKSLSHSFSKDFFTKYFKDNALDYTYDNIELSSIEKVKTLLESKKYQGFNVTLPYKAEILTFIDEVSEEVKQIGAANTLVLKNGKYFAHNTDAFGFHQSIKPFLTNKHEKALLLGNGGAAKAVSYALKNIGIEVIYAVRSPKSTNEFSLNSINEYMLKACKLVVNCTPVGTFPAVDEVLAFPFEHLSDEHLVVDLIYNPEKTKFLQEAEKNGATILNGYSMLKEQALASFKIWTE